MSVGVVPLWEGGPKSRAWPLLSLQHTQCHTQIAKTLPMLTTDKPQGLFPRPSWKQFGSSVTLVTITASLCELQNCQAFLHKHRPNLPVLKSSSTFMMVYSSKLSCRRTNCRLIWCMPWHSSNIADWRIRSLQRQGNNIHGINTGQHSLQGGPLGITLLLHHLQWMAEFTSLPGRPWERNSYKCNLILYTDGVNEVAKTS